MRPRRDVAESLRQRVINARHFGTLPPDGRLPSARTLAHELQADPRVVVAAYHALEREGLVERRPPSRGFFASPRDDAAPAPTRGSGRQAATPPRGRPARDPVDDLLVEALARALERDVSLPAFAEEARRATETLRLRAACVECNTDQLAWLCRELQEDYGIEAAGVELEMAERVLRTATSRARAARIPPALRRADLLVTTAAHAESVGALARALDKRHLVVAWRDDLQRDVDRVLAQEALYFVGTDPRFAEKVRADFATHPHRERVHPVLVDDEGQLAVPAGARVYVMRTAWERLGGIPDGVRALSTLRSFSSATRERLVRFVVRRNRAAARASTQVEAD